LRNVTLIRDGETVATLDIYDLLLRGNTEGDVRVRDGDVVFVPTVGPTVAVDGQVRRPAIYELRTESSLEEVITLAGGFTADANQTRLKLDRVVPGRGRSIQDIDFSTASLTLRD